MLNFYKFYNAKGLDKEEYDPLFDQMEEWHYTYRLKPIEHLIKQYPRPACQYARCVIKGRWPEAEPAIMRDVAEVWDYIRFVIKDRWPKAEPLMMAYPYYAGEYARLIIKGRWEEAEPYIMMLPSVAFVYAKKVLKCRWIGAEHYIQEDDYWWSQYIKEFNLGHLRPNEWMRWSW